MRPPQRGVSLPAKETPAARSHHPRPQSRAPSGRGYALAQRLTLREPGRLFLSEQQPLLATFTPNASYRGLVILDFATTCTDAMLLNAIAGRSRIPLDLHERLTNLRNQVAEVPSGAAPLAQDNFETV